MHDNLLVEIRHSELLKTVLSYAGMCAAGEPEDHLALMRLSAFRRHLREQGGHRSSTDTVIMSRLANNAQQAKRTMQRNPHLGAYYAQRAMLRAMGGDPDSLQKPDLRRIRHQLQLPAQAPAETHDQKLERLASRPLHDVAGHRFGERGVDVRTERQELRAENFETLQARKELAAKKRELERLAAKLDKPDALERLPPETVQDARRARIALLRQRSWSERALDDMVLIERMGRKLPQASRHPLAHIPVHLRPHHPAGD